VTVVVIRVVVTVIIVVVVVIAVGVVHRFRMVVRIRTARTHWRVISIVEVTRTHWTVVVSDRRTWTIHYVRTDMAAIPPESQRLEIFERGQREEFGTDFIVRHHRVVVRGIVTIVRDFHDYSVYAARTDSKILLGIIVTIVRLQIYVEISRIAFVADILDVIVQSDRIRRVGQDRL